MAPKLVIPGITDEAALACISRATRKYSQYVRAVEDALAGVCPFCDIDRSYNKIVEENHNWYAWPCNPPEKNTRFHFLFVPKRHVTDSEDLEDQEILDLFDIRLSVREKFDYASRGMLMRDGDATLSAGTIQHLHVHDMVPDGTGRVESPFYKGAEAEAEGLARAIVFEKIRSGTVIKGHFTAEELILIEGRL